MSSLLITDMQNLLFTAADADEGADKDKQEEEVSEEQEKDPAPEEEEDPDQKPEDSEDSPSTDPAPEQKQEGTPPGGLPTQPGEEEDKVVKVIDQFKKDLDNLKEQRIIDTLKKTYNQIEDAAKAEEEDYEPDQDAKRRFREFSNESDKIIRTSAGTELRLDILPARACDYVIGAREKGIL